MKVSAADELKLAQLGDVTDLKETVNDDTSELDRKLPEGLGLLDEDVEFKKFAAEGWTGLAEDAYVLKDSKDNNNAEDDFSHQLRTKVGKFGYKIETS
ncbi:26S proteasome complex subunit SEM1-like [Hemiscyllium ocellatum]|uniref:26S proteasome complex subunit SEM1-like n=1 Tax=Hemiscyllium ocellatum TaxID=170820 RepID=UPI00296736A4|nr:26S proteasome complex subunit SEM1-like [Hemiscyllium ocellatum]